MRQGFPPLSQLNTDLLKGSTGRTIAVILILLLAGGCGSPVFALPLLTGIAVQEQLSRLSHFVAALVTSKPHGAAQAVVENRGMPPNPPPSVAIRPEPPLSRSAREARVSGLELNLRSSAACRGDKRIEV
ncbi:MAG: hypothetical protein ACRD8U_24760 [Pyrinomonadaceae bacterium]